MSILNYAFDIVPNVKITLMKWAVVLRRLDKIIKLGIAFMFSEWKDWTPTKFSTSGTMTFTKDSNVGGKYLKVGRTVIYTFYITGTTGGVASNEIRCNLPFLQDDGFRLSEGVGLAVINEAGTVVMGFTNMRNGQTNIAIRKYDVVNYALGSVTLRCFGVYQCADLPENN